MTPRERAQAMCEEIADRVNVDLWTSRPLDVAEKYITAAIEEVEDRVANERDSHLETIERLEAENAELRDKLIEANNQIIEANNRTLEAMVKYGKNIQRN